MEILAGIPGYLGGAIAMNAGTHEKCIGDLLETVTWVDATGETVTRERQALTFSYRRADLPERSVIVEATLLLPKKASPEVREAVRQRMLQRQRSQPWGKRSAGSVFKNPPGDSAGRLIDQLGLKGLARGGARVAREHANFILNEGGATADDILGLVGEIRDRVAKQTGIQLELEVQVVGEDRGGDT
jgi:UDP-N-acetylmuramate dehydrogenase